ncbi:MAG: TIGR01906 family membrane protein [Dehalococcoidia bacterium]|nr:TIGR01906 family membrane protein [Dehalococcoidia bacterium]MYA54601.1 TIGR01906 family membrane protein [Dehalococcoidia bacterium]
MSAMRIVPMAASVAFVLAVPILLFTTNIRFLASDTGYLEGGIRRHDAAENTGIALGELDYAVGAIVRYFEDDAETLRILVFTGGQETTLFSAEETIHMEDVKGLMRTLFRANEVALGFVLAYVAGTVLWSRERSGRELAKETLAGVGVGAAFGIVVGIIALVGFESAWERMHEIIFTNDFWLLDPSKDRLIQMFPETFWAEATYIVVGMALAEAVVLVGAAGGYLWFTRPPRAEVEEQAEAEEQEETSEDGGEGGADVDDEASTDEGEATPEDEEEEESAEGSETRAGARLRRWWRLPWKGRRTAAQEEQPQPPPPQAQPPEAPNSGSI